MVRTTGRSSGARPLPWARGKARSPNLTPHQQHLLLPAGTASSRCSTPFATPVSLTDTDAKGERCGSRGPLPPPPHLLRLRVSRVIIYLFTARRDSADGISLDIRTDFRLIPKSFEPRGNYTRECASAGGNRVDMRVIRLPAVLRFVEDEGQQ